ncbi:methyltransferase domain family [Elysia marginata]|uniref:Methyltransferase domain family n=1 Tax=Elysia marginata TaxID=1093978 RepID=A0AAV4GY80_9GAST|nr:methyltransferase domain family [Elysia marginata]
MSALEDERAMKEFARVSTDTDTRHMYSDSSQVEHYAKYRPRYSEEVFQYIVDYCKETTPELNLCVDVGCGSGQSTIGFAKHLKKVIGVDISKHQIYHAPKHLPNVEFKVSSAEKLPFIESASVDLWSSAESFNYMPEKETFAEADRVLKPGGTLVIFGYVGLSSKEKPINDAIRKIMFKLLPYWPKESKATFEKFKDVKLPYSGWMRNDEMKKHQKMTIEDFKGLWKSFYAFVAYQEAHSDKDVLGEFEKDLRDAYIQVFGPTEEMIFDISSDIFILIGRKPLE